MYRAAVWRNKQCIMSTLRLQLLTCLSILLSTIVTYVLLDPEPQNLRYH